MKNKTLITATFLSAFATSAAFSEDVDNQQVPKDYLASGCEDVTIQLDYIACTGMAALEAQGLSHKIIDAVETGKFTQEEVERVIVSTFKNDQSCQNLAANRGQIVTESRAFLDKDLSQNDLQSMKGFDPVTRAQFKAAANLFADMGVCYNNIAARINADGSQALQEKAPLYEDLAQRALAVQKDLSAKIQP